jgi:hypothetical protein
LTVGSELTEQEPFLAQVEVDEYMTGEYGEQIHLAVRPLEFAVAQDKTGQFHEWYKPSTKTTSKCGALLAGLKAIGIGDEVGVGEGELVGTVAYFVRKTIEFGKNRDGEVLKAEDCLLPFGPATDQDVARAKASGASTGNKVAATPDAPDWTDDEIAAVIKLIEGKKQAQFQIAAARSKLAPELKNAVLSGAAVKYLLELDVIEVSRAGVVTSKLDDDEEDEDEEGVEPEDEDEEEEDDEDEDEEEGEEDEEDLPV